MTDGARDWLERATHSSAAGDAAAALAACAAGLARFPAAVELRRLEAVLLLGRGDTAKAAASLEALLAIAPDDVVALGNLGPLLCRAGDAEGGLRLLARAAQLAPESAGVRANLAGALCALGRLEEALAAYDAALGLDPGQPVAVGQRALVLERLGRRAEAIAACEAALGRPRAASDAALADLLAGLWQRAASDQLVRREYAAAVASLRRAVALRPRDADLAGELAAALVRTGQWRAALALYRDALARAPGNARLWCGLGDAWMEGGDMAKAATAFARACGHDPGNVELRVRLATALRRSRRYAEACAEATRARALAPDDPGALLALLDARLALADWSGWDDLLGSLAGIARARPEALPTPALLPLVDDPALLRRSAEGMYGAMRPPGGARPAWPARAPGPLRVAYVSSDFGVHPVGMSLVEVLERHDRARVRVVGLSLRPHAPSAVHARLAAACDEFHEVADTADADVVALARRLDLDIAVDLNGHTHLGRPGLFMAGLARVQVGYLGYPGTSGGTDIDYLVADRVVIPDESLGHYTERVVRLPGCFFPSDTRAPVGAAPRRADAGLPEDAFVFAALSSTRRLLPETFDAWLRILAAAPRAVLWVHADPDAGANLERRAAAQGVDPARLVFAPWVATAAEHLSRQALADVALDLFPYAGHSTVRDALWAGVPVITRAGRSFASRVAPSLLTAAGLGDFVARDLAEYEALAVGCVHDPARLARARERLRQHAALPLFDMAGLCDRLEAAYAEMLAAWEGAARARPSAR
jgi:predicted O-linked N-acetylglucosamine transferase (SPINDLY family)